MKRQPNILMFMVDQLTPFAMGAYGNRVVKAPRMDRLAGEGVVFTSAYCNSPLCAPARFSFMSGRLPAAIAAYDNAAYFPANQPTLAHGLRALGYRTSLAGKMHFIGPDQLHGFEERRTTDIYPADFGWVPDWRHTEERFDWWYHNMSSVTGAGVAEITNQLEFDDEVGSAALQALYDFARDDSGRPFFLCASFTHPHDPYVARAEYWGRYRDADIDLPRVPAMAEADLDPHSRRLRQVYDYAAVEITDQDIRNARRAYYGNISYLDDWLGRLLDALGDLGLADDTVVILVGDHGEMLGERGLWYKMSLFESSVRVPMIVHAPGRFSANRADAHVSLVDMLPTLLDLGGGSVGDFPGPIDGRSLLPLLEGGAGEGEVFAEFLGEGAVAPLVMIRRGRWKYVQCPADPPQLFDLEADPDELDNLAGSAAAAEVEAGFAAEVAERWDLADLHERVLVDQQRRRYLHRVLSQGRITAWDFQPFSDAADRFMRNHKDLNQVEHKGRFPRD